ncbi:tetratricopeptide repeat domain protein [Coleofasciculus chthonoplastes PCC 7420]|uniref:Tetratricopeptide repeat domain protein n=1 Tax=Coleofasciculus chthonoplastes PCC 7420 TaxID=118168 RepID=B4W0X6_9CYAN|nr:tetratricopeptide repeat protein [Coleofasciculus chthonoplastes]EDX72248.1 tetratricopeptide repeat domain protein [Coleofasciculus chthonoplastes PCC 7420]
MFTSLNQAIKNYRIKLEALEKASKYSTNKIKFTILYARLKRWCKALKAEIFRSSYKTIFAVVFTQFRYLPTALKANVHQPSDKQKRVIDVLLARDAVEAIQLEKNQDSPDTLLTLIDLDKRLREQAKFIAQTVELPEWRKSLKLPPKAWWWFFPPPVHPQDRFDWSWSGLSVLFFTASLGLLVNISSRVLTGGPDLLGALAISVQSVLTLLAAKGALTESGKEGIKQFLENCNLSKHWWQEIKLGLALLVCVILGTIYWVLPRFAEPYRQHGYQEYQAGRLASAESDYKRALAMNPDDAKTHFYLGLLYEELQDFKRASTEYKYAIQGGYQTAFNNLARLYILKKDYANAGVLLTQLKKKSIENKRLEYTLYKNFGWLYLEKNYLTLAKEHLNIAIYLADQLPPSLDERPGSAHCLLAQVLNKENDNTKEEQKQWEYCISDSPEEFPEEVIWLAMAKERLLELKTVQVK